MAEKYNYTVLSRAALNGAEEIEFPGAYIRVQNVSGGNFGIRLHAKSNDLIPLRTGEEISMPFSRFYIEADADTDVTLFISSSKTAAVGGVSVNTSGSVNVSSTASVDTVAVGSVATLLAAGSGRTSLIIRPAGAVYIGFTSGVTTATGWLVTEDFVLDHYNGPVYAIVASGSVNVHTLIEGA